jgi:F-type H+-transporting ATPase subunit b
VELNATFLLQLAIILVLLAWLSPVLFAPMLKLFDEREKRIHGAAEDAKRYLGAADEKAALIEERTKAAMADARKVLADLRGKAQNAEKDILDAARAKAGERLESARVELAKATEGARASLQSDTEKLAKDIVEKVLGRAA